MTRLLRGHGDDEVLWRWMTRLLREDVEAVGPSLVRFAFPIPSCEPIAPWKCRIGAAAAAAAARRSTLLTWPGFQRAIAALPLLLSCNCCTNRNQPARCGAPWKKAPILWSPCGTPDSSGRWLTKLLREDGDGVGPPWRYWFERHGDLLNWLAQNGCMDS